MYSYAQRWCSCMYIHSSMYVSMCITISMHNMIHYDRVVYIGVPSCHVNYPLIGEVYYSVPVNIPSDANSMPSENNGEIVVLFVVTHYVLLCTRTMHVYVYIWINSNENKTNLMRLMSILCSYYMPFNKVFNNNDSNKTLY